MKRKIVTLFGCALAVSAFYTPVYGAGYDSGRVMDQTRERPVPKPKKPAQIDVIDNTVKPAAKAGNGMKVMVRSINITGASSFSEGELFLLVSSYVGKEMALDEMQKIPNVIKAFYNSKGFFLAHAFLPPQEINNGVIQVAVLEGKVDKVVIKRAGDTRISDNLINGRMRDFQSGNSVNRDKLEESLLLMGDIPGLNVKAELQPGSLVGTTDIILNVKEKSSITGSLDTDNYGNYFTGEYRGGVTLNVNDPGGLGDQLTLRAATAGEGLINGKVSYAIPVGDYGTKVGASFSWLHYKIGKEYKLLDQKGESAIASVYAIHPLLVNRDLSLYAQLGYDYKSYRDHILTETDNKSAHVGNASILLSAVDGFAGGGITNNSFTLNVGELTLGDTLKHWDLTKNGGPNTEGLFGRINMNLNRLQSLMTGSTFLYLSLDGQVAFNNLDSTEKYSLGGPYGVRAYPTGEASGDDGFQTTVEIRQNLSFLKEIIIGDVQLAGFYDFGLSRLNSREFTGGSDETVSRGGAGVGLNWGLADNFSLRTTAAWTTGGVPNQLSDGTNRAPRMYFQFVKWF